MMDETRRFQRTIAQPVQLTEAERLALGQEIASAAVAYDIEEQAKKDAGKTHGAAMKELRALMRAKSKLLKQGYESREVPCETAYDYRLGEVRVTRLDTGETLGNRPMTTEERQTTLPAVEDALMENVVAIGSKGVRTRKAKRPNIHAVPNTPPDIVEDDLPRDEKAPVVDPFTEPH